MGRRSSRGSVYNKRANEQVQNARTSSSGGGGFIPQAYAQSTQNPTQGRQPQANTYSNQQQDPWARASQFAQNVGRGAADTGRSYTTDFYDMAEATVTGREREERSYEDETLAGVFGRGLFEGNLEGSWDEAGRRIKEEPGRVVGEVAAEAAILGATMGFGAAVKGARIGATGIKSIRGATKVDGAVGWKRKTGLIRKGTEEKYIGNKRTTVITKNRKGVEKRRVKRTNILDRLERFGATHGEKFSNKIGRPTRLGNPMIVGASGLGKAPTNLGLGNDFNIISKAKDAKLGAKDIPTESITGDIAKVPSGGGGGKPGKFTSESVDLGSTYPMRMDGADGDLAYMGSNTIAPFAKETVEETSEQFFNRRARQIKDEVDYTQPSGSNTGRKMLDGSTEEWMGFNKLNSGGQGGMDQLALETASDSGLATGGWMPKGFETIGGGGKEIAKKFNLKENDVVGYPARTKKNIAETDGTAVFYEGTPSGGTKLTIDEAKRQGKPLIENPTPEAFNIWGKQFNIGTVNVGGPRATNLTQGAKDRAVRAIRGARVSKTKTENQGKTQEEWITHYQDMIGSNRGIKPDTSITKTAQEKGVGSMDSLSYSTDIFNTATKVKGKPPRTHSASIPIDVSAAQVQAETIIRSGFGKGQSAKDLKAQLDNLVGGYASEDATIVKTNVQKNPKGSPIPENTGLGTDVSMFGLDKNNQVVGAIPSRIGETFKEVTPTTIKNVHGFVWKKQPKTQQGLIATGKELKSGGSKVKTDRKRLWEIEGEEGKSTELDYNQLSGDDLQIPGISNMPIDEQDFLVATQIDPVKMVGGKLVGNPQLGLSKQANTKNTEKALDAILGSKGGPDDGYWVGKRRPHFGYDAFRVKYNLGILPAQKGVVPKKQLPSKLHTFITQRNLTQKDYYDLSFQTSKRGKDASTLKRFVQGDVVKEEYTGDAYQDSIWTKTNFMAAGSGTRKGDLLPIQNLVSEIGIVNRNRLLPISKRKRYSTPFTPKTIIEKDESLVAFDINRIRELERIQGTTAVKKRVAKPNNTRAVLDIKKGVPRRYGKKKNKPKKVKSFADMVENDGYGINPNTGDVDPTTIQSPFRMPSWMGDTTVRSKQFRY